MLCQKEADLVLNVKNYESSFHLNAIQTSISRSLARFSSLISEYLENLDSVISSLTGLEYKWCSSDLELWVSSSSSLSSSWLWKQNTLNVTAGKQNTVFYSLGICFSLSWNLNDTAEQLKHFLQVFGQIIS